MAIALYFRRITGPDTTGQDTTVLYEYGPNPGQTPHRVMIDAVTGYARVADGTWDSDMGRVARQVRRLRRETGGWPEKGGYFS